MKPEHAAKVDQSNIARLGIPISTLVVGALGFLLGSQQLAIQSLSVTAEMPAATTITKVAKVEPKSVTMEECDRQRLGIPDPQTGKILDTGQRTAIQCYQQLQIQKLKAEAEARAAKFVRMDSISGKANSDHRMMLMKMKIAMDVVKDRLRDPQSAEFKDVELDSTTGVICGNVNAKNSFGGYTGFSPFLVAGDEKPFAYIVQSGDRTSTIMWQTFCS